MIGLPPRKLPNHLHASFDRIVARFFEDPAAGTDPDHQQAVEEHNAAVRAWHAEQDAAEQDGTESGAGR